MSIVKYNPFRPYRPVPVNSLFDDFFGRSVSDFVGSDFTFNTPSVNIVEKDNAYLIEVAAPGLGKEDFNIELDNENLIISASNESKSEEKDEDGKYTRREFNYNSFKRSFHISDEINTENIDANYANGVLTITLAKRDEVIKQAPKTIEIK